MPWRTPTLKDHTMPGTKTAAIGATADTATEVTAAAEAEAAPAKPDNTVTLDFPIKRGAGEITEITLRKPMAGDVTPGSAG